MREGDIMPRQIQCSINGQETKVPEGSLVIEAFKKQAQEISHYCWHPGLSSAGVCRLCMVEIEGDSKLSIACNTKVQEGMRVSNQSEKVKEAVRWGLEYHLINHPLDCPICDQAGECDLQDQYMKFGSYDSSMAEAKVKKRKVVDLGPKIVLDTERCILCSRCVRFTDEVSRTHELGIFNRGDRSEIGVFQDRPLDNNYSINTVDICPVGALTHKDFRFRQRVWYLKTAPSVCPGCSTACNTDVDYNEEGLFRVRPRFNKEINGHWMCDKGRPLYKSANKKIRSALKGENSRWIRLKTERALKEIKVLLEELSPDFVLTGQYSNEEYQALLDFFPKSSFYHWISNKKTLNDFDGLLLRGDKNPNTKGLKKIFPKIKPFTEFEKNKKNIPLLFVLGPEFFHFFLDMEEKTKLFSQCERLVWMSLAGNPFLPAKENFFQIPMKSFFEKTGSFVNFKGMTQKVLPVKSAPTEALSVEDCIHFFKKGKWPATKRISLGFKQNRFLNQWKKVW